MNFTAHVNPSVKEKEAIRHLRNVFKNELEMNPEINTAWYLLRFYRARGGNLDKVEDMLKEFFEWRNGMKKRNVQLRPKEDFDEIKKIHARGLYGTDKAGRPVSIDLLHQTDLIAFLSPKFDDIREDYIYMMKERSLHITLPIASKQANRRIDSIFLIYDMKGVDISKLFDSKFKEFVRFLIRTAQSNYPEILGKMFIINASFSFRMTWNVIKLWMNKVTRDKIEVHAGCPLDKLAQYMDKDKIPSFLGGPCQIPLSDNHGPWKPYLEEAFQNKSFFLNDREPEYEYFYTKEEKKKVLKKITQPQSQYFIPKPEDLYQHNYH